MKVFFQLKGRHKHACMPKHTYIHTKRKRKEQKKEKDKKRTKENFKLQPPFLFLFLFISFFNAKLLLPLWEPQSGVQTIPMHPSGA